MAESGRTSMEDSTNLTGLQNNEEAEWSRLRDQVEPLLRAQARRCGLCADDAEDAIQLTLLKALQAIREGRYQREKGRLRDYLRPIFRRTIVELLRKRPDAYAPTGLLQSLEDPESLDEMLDQADRDHVFQLAIQQFLADETISVPIREAFRLRLLGESVVAIARKLHTTENNVHQLRHRAKRRLQELVNQVSHSF